MRRLSDVKASIIPTSVDPGPFHRVPFFDKLRSDQTDIRQGAAKHHDEAYDEKIVVHGRLPSLHYQHAGLPEGCTGAARISSGYGLRSRGAPPA
jgi:hypothetical protein